MIKTIHILWSNIKQQRKKQLWLLLIVMIFTSFAEVISIGSVIPFLGLITVPQKVFDSAFAKPIIEVFSLSTPQELLLPLTLLFIIAIMLSAGMRIFLLWLQTKIAFAIGSDFSNEIYRRTLYQPYQVHTSRNTSQLIGAVYGKSGAVVSNGVLPLLNIVSGSLILVFVISTIVIINYQVAIVALIIFGSVYVVIAQVTKKKLAANSYKIGNSITQVIKIVQEGIGGIRDVLIDGTQEVYSELYRNADYRLRQAQISNTIIGGIPRYLIEALGITLIAFFAFVLSLRGAGFVESIPMLGAIAIGAQRLLPIMQQFYQSWSSLKGGQSSLNDVLDLINQPLPNNVSEQKFNPIKYENTITLKNICFRYANHREIILNDINLEIKKGSRVGFMGTTGSGKSTLLDILMGLLEPTSGSLIIDNTQITQKNYRSWQAHIAHVPQTIFLADLSIAENIAFGVSPNNINMSLVQNVAEKAQIASSINTWKDKYNTLVGERGVRLSGGQRQRIGIARALYKQAQVIIFDEATSALDTSTENSLMKEIDSISRDITLIMVAHRVDTLKQCDEIFELIDGKITRKIST